MPQSMNLKKTALLNPGRFCYLSFLNPGEGLLRHPIFGIFRRDCSVLNIKDGDLYTILRLVEAEGDAVVLLSVDSDKIEADMEAGLIKVHRDDHAFILSGSKAELDRYIETNINTLFSLEAVGIVELISGELK